MGVDGIVSSSRLYEESLQRRTDLKKLLMVAAAVVCLMMGTSYLHAQDAGSNGISGKWHFVLATPGGDRELDADFTVDNDGNVTGKWGPADVVGSYKEGKLALKFPFTSDEVGTTADMSIDGKVDDSGGLGGDWAFSEYNGTFLAKRPTATPAEVPAAASATEAKPQ
jgi:hypothetical protein